MIVLVGSNLCIAHPILWQRVLPQPAPAGDHRHRSAHDRDRDGGHAAPARSRPKSRSDAALRPRPPADRARLDRPRRSSPRTRPASTTFAAFVAAVHARARRRGNRHRAEASSTSSPRTIHEGKRVSFWWTMGVNQSHEGVRTAQAIINLALMTGNIGRPGTGANSITGQCNAMGSRLFSNTTNLLGGHDFANAAHRREGRRASSASTSRASPTEPSLGLRPDPRRHPARQDQGPVGRSPPTRPTRGSTRARCATILGRLDFLVVQDMYPTTETAQLADLVLPAAGWGEKEGTFINSERRIGLIKKVARAPGQALADFSIFQLIAEYWGCGEMFRRVGLARRPCSRSSSDLSRGQPCDITGIDDYRNARRARRHPMALSRAGDDLPPNSGGCSRTAASIIADGRARFLFEAPRPMPEPPNEKLSLPAAHRPRHAPRSGTRRRAPRKSAVLRKLYPQQPYVEIHPDDARREHIRPNEQVVVESQRGRIDGPRPRDADRPAAAGLHPDALRRHQPADARPLRSVLAPAVVQGLRRANRARRRATISGASDQEF